MPDRPPRMTASTIAATASSTMGTRRLRSPPEPERIGSGARSAALTASAGWAGVEIAAVTAGRGAVSVSGTAAITWVLSARRAAAVGPRSR